MFVHVCALVNAPSIFRDLTERVEGVVENVSGNKVTGSFIDPAAFFSTAFLMLQNCYAR
jgi:hypothetical protein